jgi:hypothetical protein
MSALGDLVAKKANLEQQIAQSIEVLETAIKSTSREFQTVLQDRAEAVTAASPMLSDVTAAAASAAHQTAHTVKQ